MAQKLYTVTDKAGRYVAGTRNTGVGTTLSLTDKQAEAALRDGTLVEAPEGAGQDAPFAVATVTDTAANARGEVDSLPEATDPDAPARAAGSATVKQAVEEQRTAEGKTLAEPTAPVTPATAAPTTTSPAPAPKKAASAENKQS